jgi:hypothetical protein
MPGRLRHPSSASSEPSVRLLRALGFREDGVHVGAVVFRFPGVVHDEHAQVDAYLWRSQPHATIGAHELQHAGGEGLEVLVEVFDGRADFFQAWIRVENDSKIVIHARVRVLRATIMTSARPAQARA